MERCCGRPRRHAARAPWHAGRLAAILGTVALWSAAGAAAQGAPPAFVEIASFSGIPFNGLIPPNPVIAVGGNHILAMTNGDVRIATKTGEVLAAMTLEAFFAPVAEPSDFITDPRILFDSGRFFVVAASRRTNPLGSFFLLAVSASADPSGAWFHYALDASRDNQTPTQNFADLPSLGIDSNSVYLTANMFHQQSLAFAGAKIRVVRKAPLLAGEPATFFDFPGLNVAGRPVAHILAAHQLDPSLAGFFLSVRFPDSCTLDVWRVVSPPSTLPPVCALAIVSASRWFFARTTSLCSPPFGMRTLNSNVNIRGLLKGHTASPGLG